MNFKLIRMFFMYVGDFRANFCVFLTIVLFYLLKLKRPLLLGQILYNKCGYSFCGYESFFVEKYDKKWQQLEIFF